MYGIVANVSKDSILRDGAKVWINFCNGDAERPKVFGLSKRGRIIHKYTRYSRLRNYRVAFIPAHWTDLPHFRWDTKEQAQEWASALNAKYECVEISTV